MSGGAAESSDLPFDAHIIRDCHEWIWQYGLKFQRTVWVLSAVCTAAFCAFATLGTLPFLLTSGMLIMVSDMVLYWVSDKETRRYLGIGTMLHAYSWAVVWTIFFLYNKQEDHDVRVVVAGLLVFMHVTVFTGTLLAARAHGAMRPRHMMVNSRVGSGVYY